MRLALLTLAAAALLRCASLPDGVLFACDDTGSCAQQGFHCDQGRCVPDIPDAGQYLDAGPVYICDGGVFVSSTDTYIETGDNQHGVDAQLNLGTATPAGRGLISFRVDAISKDVLHLGPVDGGVSRFELQLTRVSGQPATAGTLDVFPLRTDWYEGLADNASSGAIWSKPQGTGSSVNWGTPGAMLAGTDHGTKSGSLTTTGSESTLSIPLDPSVFRGAGALGDWVQPSGVLSMLVVTNSGQSVVGSRDSSSTTPPRLFVSYCTWR